MSSQRFFTAKTRFVTKVTLFAAAAAGVRSLRPRRVAVEGPGPSAPPHKL
jgi:hypothetical protein